MIKNNNNEATAFGLDVKFNVILSKSDYEKNNANIKKFIGDNIDVLAELGLIISRITEVEDGISDIIIKEHLNTVTLTVNASFVVILGTDETVESVSFESELDVFLLDYEVTD